MNDNTLNINNLWTRKAHYGGKKKNSHPKMIKFTSNLEKGKYFFDLNQTLDSLEKVGKKLGQIDEAGKKILFVSTKPKLRGILGKYIGQTDHYYIDNRWLGGLLTNFDHLQKRTLLLQKMENDESKGINNHLTKKELLNLNRKKKSLQINLKGIAGMKKLPDYLFVIDPTYQKIACLEAKTTKIPVFSMLNTASNPSGIQEIIPINDDSPRVLELVLNYFIENNLHRSKPNNDLVIEEEKSDSKDKKLNELMKKFSRKGESNGK